MKYGLRNFNKIILLIYVVGLLVFVHSPSRGDVIRVPDDQATIPAAITSATNGDEIRVYSGHLESSVSRISVYKSLSIISYATGYTTKEIGATIEITGTGQYGMQLSADATNVLLEGLIIRPDFRAINISSSIGSATLTMIDCTLADGTESGIRCDGVSDMTLIMTRCTLTGFGYRGIHMRADANVRNQTVTITDCDFVDSENPAMYFSTAGDGIYSISDCRFDNLVAGGGDPAIRIVPFGGTHTHTISDCVFGAVAPNVKNLQIISFEQSATQLNMTTNIDRCKFFAASGGASLELSGERTSNPSSSADMTITNCLLESGSAAGAFATQDPTDADADILFQHCTIVAKDNNQDVVTSHLDSGTLSLANCIIQGGSAGLYDSTVAGDDGVILSNFNIINSNLFSAAGDVTLGANDIIGVDPLLVDEVNHDYRLQELSPAKDAGTDLGVMLDLAGLVRDSTPDIGCYEIQPPMTSVSDWDFYR